MSKHLQSNQKFWVLIDGRTYIVYPFDAEKELNNVGFSNGFVHFRDATTSEVVGFAGIDWFERNAVAV